MSDKFEIGDRVRCQHMHPAYRFKVIKIVDEYTVLTEEIGGHKLKISFYATQLKCIELTREVILEKWKIK